MDNLIIYLNGIVSREEILIIPHPSFWSDINQKLLEQFIKSLELYKLNFSIYEQDDEYKFQDISFELYNRGSRNFFCCDSTIQVTVENYPNSFKDLCIYSMSKIIDNKTGILEQEFLYKNGKKQY